MRVHGALTVWILAGSAVAQPQAWSRYHEAVEAAERGDHAVALPLLRAAQAEAEEPALKAAICFGIGHSIQAVLDPETPERALACEGRDALQCFLDSPRQDAAARARAAQQRDALAETCEEKVVVVVQPPPEPPEPAPSPDNSTAWWLTGGAIASGVVGATLLGLAVADAAEVRDRGRVDTEDLESRAQIEWGVGWGLVGTGVVLGALAWWRWDGGVAVGPSGVSWSYAW